MTASRQEKTEEEPLVRFHGVTKRFGSRPAVDDLSLDIFPGEFFALLGPSGCGKTTLLRLLAGLETPDAGRIVLDGSDIGALPPHRRPVNMMFQSYALFPHLSVQDNVAFGLRQEKLPKAEIDERVRDMLVLLQISDLGARYPQQLSGGERQRVALARALVKRPKVFLLDEPLAALDKRLRTQTQSELTALQRRLGVTFIMVTHDQDEAMMMADRIGVMDRGRLMQIGTPTDIYERPNSRWVGQFVGEINLLEGTVTAQDGQHVLVDAGGRTLRVAHAGAVPAGNKVTIAVRPEKLQFAATNAKENSLRGRVVEIGYQGDSSLLTVALEDGHRIRAKKSNISTDPSLSLGAQVNLAFAPEAAFILLR